MYNVLNLGVDCGDASGTVYSELMGGYGSERDNALYVHGVKDGDGGRKQDDFENRFTIDWDDRFDDNILESIGNMCFITVGLEKDKQGKTYPKKFLSAYDAIAYVKEHLESGTVVNVKGSLKYSMYQDCVQVKKEITSIFLSKADDIRIRLNNIESQINVLDEKISTSKDKDEVSKLLSKADKLKSEYETAQKEFSDAYKPKSVFTQTMLLKKDGIGTPDKDKGVIPIYATILDYTKMWGDKEVKCLVPFKKTFEYEIDLSDRAMVEKAITKVFKVKKGCTEITFDGDLIEGGALVTVTEDDIPDEIKDLIEIGAYTLEEALTKCTENTSKEKRMVIRRPVIKMVGEEGSKIPVIQKTENKYTEEDLILDFMYQSDDDDSDVDEADVEDGAVENADEDEDWLSKL